MVNEWAELGNLKEVYNNYDISWNVKIQIALDICRGICFMHENKILHHNLQCANIMMSGYCEPKITNFEYSYYVGDGPSIIPTIDNVINWTAPEKIENLVSYKYDTKCEVFRENINSIKNEKVYEDYFEIVKNAWNQNPEDRDQFTIIFNKLEQLVFRYYKNGISLYLTSKFTHYFTTKPIDELEARAKLWIEDMIEKKVVKSIEWSEFNSDSAEEIGKGNFGSIIKIYWTNDHNYVVCKKLINSSDIQYKAWEAFKHELHMQSRAHSCENIIRILGISKSDKGEYHIVMEYANEGDLKCYLLNHFKELDWNKKFKLALDITNGLYFLHKEKILHRDLHAKNIVIHKGKAKITDFGYSESMNTAIIIHENLFGNIRYVAPEILRASKAKQYPYTEYSDIYSLGVLLWEISSGRDPFEDHSDYTVLGAILSGYREERIKNTPDEYYDLYSKCWSDEPKNRCTIDYVYYALKKILDKIENDDKKEVDDKKGIDKSDNLSGESQLFSFI
ncbi:unnamed protein product [Rhizophagus irregularis]|nr:unnamed protein product [Rhizophagus irregularis]